MQFQNLCAFADSERNKGLFLLCWLLGKKKQLIFYFLFFQISAEISVGEPYKGCATLTNADDLKHRIAVLERGECMFIDKVLWSPLQAYRALLGL